MTIAEVLMQDFDNEMKSTRTTLERIPEDKPDYKPHEKSMAMGRLAMHVAYLPMFGKYVLTTPGMDIASPTAPRPDLTFTTREHMLKAFDESAAAARAALAATSDEDMQAHWKFSFGDRVITDMPRSATYRGVFFNHLIHHRAQLGVYLRLNDVPVPATYGPSADDRMGF
ncbi:MAG: DinB family protein [Acidobacteriaceae bacterium]